ncbi:hypothetical protein ACFFX0_29535 [Citricoccus parietis]|uniref:Uncharacterized protein n=1 Tax=Citricoccus parietis TaxID=592307 RepID=A0ABV5G1W4_9MICC
MAPLADLFIQFQGPRDGGRRPVPGQVVQQIRGHGAVALIHRCRGRLARRGCHEHRHQIPPVAASVGRSGPAVSIILHAGADTIGICRDRDGV